MFVDKLLVVTPKYPPQPGGASYVFSLLSENLSRKIDVTVLTSTESGFVRLEKRKNVEVFRLFPYFENILKKIIFLPLSFSLVLAFFIINHRKFDVIETHTVGELCIFSQLFAKIFRKKLVKHILDMSAHEFMLKHPMPDMFVNCGETITMRLSALRIPEAMIKEIRLPIAYVKNKTYKKKGKKILLFVGEISERKGITDILYAISRLKQDFEFWFVGSGPMVRDLKKASDKDIRIKYFGTLENKTVIELMRKTDILVHPTRADVMPLSILEAMMMGNAILSSDIGEIKKNVGKAGIIIKPGDKESLIKSIASLLGMDLGIMKKTSLENFRKYSKEDVYERNLDVIRKV